MNNLLKLHLNLLKYIRLEFKNKKKKNKEHLAFLKMLAKQYGQVLLNEYRKLFLNFDPEYRKQKKQYKKYQQLRKDLESGIKMLFYLDNKLKKAGVSRHIRRRFWDDFRKYPEARQKVLDNLLREIRGEKLQ